MVEIGKLASILLTLNYSIIIPLHFISIKNNTHFFMWAYIVFIFEIEMNVKNSYKLLVKIM